VGIWTIIQLIAMYDDRKRDLVGSAACITAH
jgi:hypothetical protein